jgi:hypothetical protein
LASTTQQILGANILKWKEANSGKILTNSRKKWLSHACHHQSDMKEYRTKYKSEGKSHKANNGTKIRSFN